MVTLVACKPCKVRMDPGSNPREGTINLETLVIYKEALIHVSNPKNFNFASSVEHQIDALTPV